MYVVLVHVHVKPDHRDAFLEETRKNAAATVQEPLNLRFDILQQHEAINRFTLVEVYRSEAGMSAHKETAHYAAWREAVADWMAEPRMGVKYTGLFPEDAERWATQSS